MLLGAAALGWLVNHLARSAAAAGFTTIDTRRVRLDGPVWTPPDWEEWMGARIAERGPLSSLDSQGIQQLVAELEAMPSVLSVRQSKVLWPDGLAIEVALRRPIACVRTGAEFLGVAADGVLLPGYWSAPPNTGDGFLPVIGPNDGALDGLVAGDRLTEEKHLDALSVALSLRQHLAPEMQRELGPVLIDATHAAAAAVEEPGTRLYLEERRLVLYGRPPRAAMPGELPEKQKWAHLAHALELLQEDPPLDWDLVDLRWDRARIRPRGESD